MYAYLPSFFLTTTMGMSQDVSKCLKRPWLPTTLRSPGRGCRRCSWAAQLPWWVRLRPPWQQPSSGSWWRWPEALGLGRNHPSFLVGKLQPTISFQHLLLGRNPFKACCFLLFSWLVLQKRYRISKQMFLQMCPFQNNPENNPPAPAFLLNPVFSLGKSVNPMIVGSLLSFSSWSAKPIVGWISGFIQKPYLVSCQRIPKLLGRPPKLEKPPAPGNPAETGPQVPTLQGCGAFGLLSFIIAQVAKRLK